MQMIDKTPFAMGGSSELEVINEMWWKALLCDFGITV